MKIAERILHPLDTAHRLRWLCTHLRPVYESWRLKREVLGMQDKDAFRDEIEYLASVGIYTGMPFPYPVVRQGVSTCDIKYDSQLGLPYIEADDGRLFFPARQSLDSIASLYLSYVNDEGITEKGCRSKSPHSYVSPGFGVEQGDVLLDVGSAEALFTLHNVGKVSRAYVFEAKPEWERPLNATFAPWKNKVQVISKYVSPRTEGHSVRLQDAIEADSAATYFVKMDIEGAEQDVILASKYFLTSHRVKLSCCVYHRHDDDAVISKMLKDMGFRMSYSEGYMLVRMGKTAYPYFRHGVIHAINY